MSNSSTDLLADRHMTNVGNLLDRADQLRSMARQLWLMAKIYDGEANMAGDAAIADLRNDDQGPGLAHLQLVWLARRAYDARRERDRMFGGGLFAEPAWDMLLDLFIQTLNGRKVHTKQILGASAVPATTALRYIGQLEHAGLVQRASVSTDRRVRNVVMSGKCVNLMIRYFSTVAADWIGAPSNDGAVDGATIRGGNPRRKGDVIGQGQKAANSASSGKGRAAMAVLSSVIDPPETGLSIERIMSRVRRIGRHGARLLLCFLEIPGRSIPIAELVEVLNDFGVPRPDQANPVAVDKLIVRRRLSQVRMALRGVGIDQPVVWASGGYSMSTEAAARITGYLYDR